MSIRRSILTQDGFSRPSVSERFVPHSLIIHRINTISIEVSLSDPSVLAALRSAHKPERIAFRKSIARVMGFLKLAPEPVFGPPIPLPPKGTSLPGSLPLAPTPPPSPAIPSGWQLPFGPGDVVTTSNPSCVDV